MHVLNALVAGNGSYIVRPCGHDLHGPTWTKICLEFSLLRDFTMSEKYVLDI